MKESMVFYASWLDAIKNLPREMQGEVLTTIIEYGLYGETTASLKPITRAMLALVKTQIDINNKRYENSLKGGRKGISETKPKPNQNQTETKPEPNLNQTQTKLKPNQNQTETKPEPNNVNENENVNDIIIPPVYIPPLQGGNTHTELSESDKPPEQDNCVTTESPPVAEEKEKSCAKKEKEPVKRFQKPTIEEVRAYITEKGYDVDAERFWNFYEAKDWFIGKNKMKNWRAAVATWQKKETDYVDIRQKRHDRRRGTEIRATCAEDYSEPL